MKYIKWFAELGRDDIEEVGGKNASLGEMFNSLGEGGIKVPDGFAITAKGFRFFLNENDLNRKIKKLLDGLDTEEFTNLSETSSAIRKMLLDASIPKELGDEINKAYLLLTEKYGENTEVAVRSSATAEDLPTASFAGQHDTFLNIKGSKAVIGAIQGCFASLYNGRAIKYRHDNGFEHEKVALSAGIQIMVRSDLGSAGVCFSLEPESGFRDVVVINGCWGLGENIVQGAVNPDEFHVFKTTLLKGIENMVKAEDLTKKPSSLSI